ncbi:MAG: TetR/AcrR family transcriptional regulator [Longimicrobiales bacterium]
MAKGEATRQTILDHALARSSMVGLEGVTIGALASELQLSKSGLFAHFKSKEALQIAVLEEAADRFTEVVIRPALREPRGEGRVRALFERWLAWTKSQAVPGGCVFVSASVEYDDQPGPVRDYLVRTQQAWIDLIGTTSRFAVEAGHFRANLDGLRFAQDFYGILLSHYHFTRLLRDPDTEPRTRAAFEYLIARSRVGSSGWPVAD